MVHIATRPSSSREMIRQLPEVAPTISGQQMLRSAKVLNSVDNYSLECSTSDVRSTPVGWNLHSGDSFEARIHATNTAGEDLGYDQLDVSVEANGVSINESAHGRPHHQTPTSISLPLAATASPKMHYDAVNYTIVAGKTAGQGVMALMCDPIGVEQSTQPTLP
jgi:hypothetical protein